MNNVKTTLIEGGMVDRWLEDLFEARTKEERLARKKQGIQGFVLEESFQQVIEKFHFVWYIFTLKSPFQLANS